MYTKGYSAANGFLIERLEMHLAPSPIELKNMNQQKVYNSDQNTYVSQMCLAAKTSQV